MIEIDYGQMGEVGLGLVPKKFSAWRSTPKDEEMFQGL